MYWSARSCARLATLVVLSGVALAGCSSEPDRTRSNPTPHKPTPTAFTADSPSCDRDRSSTDAKDTIERVGGLVEHDYKVRFAQSTRLGVVALVDGDTTKAFHDLTDNYGVAVVAHIEDDGASKVVGFQQVQDLVASICD